jgi:hypothetical protein
LEIDGGEMLQIHGPAEVAAHVAESEAAHRVFLHSLINFLTKQSVLALGGDTLIRLEEAFRSSDFNMRALVVDIAVAASLLSSPQP